MTETVYNGTLAQALADDIPIGDRLLLKQGTFTADYTFPLSGVSVLSYPGERAKVNGKVISNGNALTFQNLEFAYLDWVTREALEPGGSPSNIPDKGVSIFTPNVKFINCIFHDLPTLGLWTPATNAEFYGCIIYHNGWSGPDRGHGHGLYVQNNAPTKIIKDCIIFNNFGYGIHAYTEGGKINNFVFDGCVCFGAGSLYGTKYNNILIGGYQVANNIIIKNCMTYGAGGVNVGYVAGATNVILEDNYFPDGIQKVNTQIANETGNYYGPAIGNRVFLRPNQYEPNRANLVVYNEAQVDTVEMDISAIYANGTQVQARNVQDYFSDIQILTVTNGKITVNMQAINRTVAVPIGWTAPATTFPQFGCFVLNNVAKTWQEWQSAGYDATGTYTPA